MFYFSSAASTLGFGITTILKYLMFIITYRSFEAALHSLHLNSQ